MADSLKILVLRWNSEPLISGLAEALKSLGHDVEEMEITATTDWLSVKSTIVLRRDLWISHCTYVFDFWRHRDDLRAHVEKSNQKVALWYWESPFASGSHAWLQCFLRRDLPTSFQFFVPDRSHIQIFRDYGYEASYLPLAALDEWFDYRAVPALKASFTEPLVFVGTPNRQVRFPLRSESDRVNAFAQLFVAELSHYLSEKKQRAISSESPEDLALLWSSMGADLTAFMQKDFCEAVSFDGARVALEAALSGVEMPGADLQEPDSRATDWLLHMRGRLEILYSWRQLTSWLEVLVPQGLHVYGGEEWRDFLLPTMSHSSQRLSDEELAASFQCAEIQICYTKWCFAQVVHERPLKILAHGGFALTDRADAVHEMFPDGGLETYASLTELKDKIAFYRRDRRARKEISAHGRQFLYEHHRMIFRAKDMLRALR